MNGFSVDLEDILRFVTGCPNVPILGFTPRPRILFELTEESMLSASTCAMTLRLTERHNTDYDSFKDDVSFSILNSPAFGAV